ncbi:MAG: hypothetical protein RIR70_277 [Pseudomonadota bacterium]|jgi:hypothetical protein
MLRTFFAAKLAKLGYPSQNIHFALEYRLGDGVAFFGHIKREHVRRLAGRLLCEQGRRDFSSNRAVIRKAIKLGASFEIMKLDMKGVDYANSMYVKCHLPAGMVLSPYEKSLIEVFTGFLRADVIATSGVLTTLGYALLAASPEEEILARVISRGDCMVLVKELPDPAFNPYETFGEEDSKRIVEHLALGVYRHYGLKLEIRAVGGVLLGEATLPGIIEDLRDEGLRSAHRGKLRSLMHEASIQARGEIAKSRLKAA